MIEFLFKTVNWSYNFKVQNKHPCKQFKYSAQTRSTALLGNLLEMQVLGPNTDLLNQNFWGEA